MIKIENTEVVGFEAAIRGMRNPMNSWDQSDSWFEHAYADGYSYLHSILNEEKTLIADSPVGDGLGPKDYQLAMKLCKAGSSDAKFRRMINVTADITAPLYWWKEYDTYKVGTVANSCSTMHKIHVREFTLEDFSCEHLITEDEANELEGNDPNYMEEACLSGGIDKDTQEPIFLYPEDILRETVQMLNFCRELFLRTKDKRYWWQMIQLLPSSYNQRRTIQLNYEVLAAIYPKRKDHKLDEWHQFCDWIELLPYSELITLKGENKNDTE